MAARVRPSASTILRGPRGIVALTGVALGATMALTATAVSAQEVVRTEVPLAVSSKKLDPWSAVVLKKGAKVRFRALRASGTVLQLTDRARRGGYVGVSTPLGPQTAVGLTARLNLTRQSLGRGRARALVSIDGTGGRSVQAGILRLQSGQLRWAVWRKDSDGGRSGLVISRARAALGHWYDMKITTRWARAKSPVELRMDGRRVVRTRLDLTGSMARRATLGFGRPSKASETGALLVRAARVKAANGLATSGGGTAPGGGSGGGGGTAPPPVATRPALPPPLTIPGRVLKVGDFETGDLSQFNSVQRVAADRIQVVRDPVRAGAYAGKFTVRQGDDPLSGNYGDRAEVSVDSNENEGQERWYSWSTMVGTDVPSTARFQVISQWHSRADGRPPVAFFAENDNLLLMVHPHRAPGDQINYTRAWIGPLKRGQWQDIQMHVRWSGSDSIGFIELWIDGVRQKFSNGSTTLNIRTMYPGISNYFKQGYYRDSSISGSGTVYHDNFRMSEPG